MKAIGDCLADECRYPMTQRSPHLFCCEPTDGRSYCPKHDRACHGGYGKDWEALAGMMAAVEQTIRPASGFERERPDTAGVDIELREGK